MVTAIFQKACGLFGTVDCAYKTVSTLMSVCYILPEMMHQYEGIQHEHKKVRERERCSVSQSLPVLIPLVIKTSDQSMTRIDC